MNEKEYELKLQITKAEAEKIQKEIIFKNPFDICQQEDIYFYPSGEEETNWWKDEAEFHNRNEYYKK